jgi:hypothetical protein
VFYCCFLIAGLLKFWKVLKLCDAYTECSATLCQYFKILFPRSYEHGSDSQRFQSCEDLKCRRLQMYYHHVGAPPHFCRNITRYLNEQFPYRWIGHGWKQNWPPGSPDLSPIDYHVWGHMKNVVNESKMDAREELLQRILDPWDTLITLQVLRTVRLIRFLVNRVSMSIRDDVSRLERLLTT